MALRQKAREKGLRPTPRLRQDLRDFRQRFRASLAITGLGVFLSLGLLFFHAQHQQPPPSEPTRIVASAPTQQSQAKPPEPPEKEQISTRREIMSLPNDDLKNQFIMMYGYSLEPAPADKLQRVGRNASEEMLYRFAKLKTGNVNSWDTDVAGVDKEADLIYQSIKEACKEFNVPTELVIALGLVEGGDFDTNCLQVTVDTAKVCHNNLRALSAAGKIKGEFINKQLGDQSGHVRSWGQLMRLRKEDKMKWGSIATIYGIYFLGNIYNQPHDGFNRAGASRA
ncbi:MAG: hypothetical protein Q8R48_06615, partial [Candidatus Omnitrophota bacterium]|nr:hypothetical protein [Candidatus Omnitrophota bacterium]